MENYLHKIEKRLIPNENGYDVVYESGEYKGSVSYVRYDMDTLVMKGKPIFLMVKSDMGDVIEYIHKRRELTSEDLSKLQMEIRLDSKGYLDEYLSRMGKTI